MVVSQSMVMMRFLQMAAGPLLSQNDKGREEDDQRRVLRMRTLLCYQKNPAI